jgi:hypothetical protein
MAAFLLVLSMDLTLVEGLALDEDAVCDKTCQNWFNCVQAAAYARKQYWEECGQPDDYCGCPDWLDNIDWPEEPEEPEEW